VVFLNTAMLTPSGNPSSGGFLYVDGRQLYFRDTTGLTTPLTVHLVGPGSSTNDAVVIFDATDGTHVQNSSVIITNDGALCVGDGSATTPGLSFIDADHIGMYRSATQVHLTAGGELSAGSGTVTCSVPLQGVNGNEASPTFSFADLTTGLYYISNHVCMSTGGYRAASVGLFGNVNLSGTGAASSGGKNVVYMEDVVTIPSGSLDSGGILYINNTVLVFHNQSGSTVNLGGGVYITGPTTSTPTALAYWSGTDGTTILSSTSLASDNTKLIGKLRYSSDALSVTCSGTDLLMQFGIGKTVVITPTTVTCPNVPVFAETSVRVGGGVDCTMSGTTFTMNNRNATGTFDWRQNGSAIFSTNASNNLVLANSLQVSGVNGQLSIGPLTSTSYGVSTVEDLLISVNNYDTVTVTSTGVSNAPTLLTHGNLLNQATGSSFRAPNGSVAAPSYSFRNDMSSGMMYDATTQSVGMVKSGDLSACVSAGPTTGCNIGMCTTTFPSYNDGEGIAYIGQAEVPPTVNSVGGYLYVTDLHALKFVVDVNSVVQNCNLNAKSKRADVQITVNIDSHTTINLDGYNWVTVDSAGVEGMSTGALSISDTNSTVLVNVHAVWASNPTGYRRVCITSGISHTIESRSVVATVNGESTYQSTDCVKRLTVANLPFAVQVYQNSGVALSCDIKMTLIRMN
jgi:hypothetical protein